jgi:hypothetical protein
MADQSTYRYLQIARTDPPRWLSEGGRSVSDDPWRELSGEQAEWGFAIPWMYRILASPGSGHEFLRAPREGDEIFVATAYWAALLHLLTYSFGWMHPERGLHAWRLAGEPTDDTRLEMLKRVWGADGMLDCFHAWTFTRQTCDTTARISALTGFVGDQETSIAPPRWLDEQVESAARSGVHTPCHGGGDPLHLSMHLEGPLEDPVGEVTVVRTDRSRRRAVLLVDSMVGWYHALCTTGAELPELGDRSWRVEVVVRPAGSLGTFRRSRETSIWFSGPHRYHRMGFGKPG